MRIALLEDDEDQAKIVQLWLQQSKYECQYYLTGKSFLDAINKDSFDLLIVDWMLPDTNGLQVLSQIRRLYSSTIPVLFVTSRDSEEDIVQALEYGADDYMIKPIKQREFIARIYALVRRLAPTQEDTTILTIGNYSIDTSNNRLQIDGSTIELTTKEFDLALYLFRNVGQILSRNNILKIVWGHSTQVNTRTVDTHISRLRNKLKLYPENHWKLAAIYQHGYRLEYLDDSVIPET